MTAEAQAIDALLDHAPLISLVGQRIDPDFIDENDPLPAIEYERGGTEPEYTLDGTLAASRVTINITVWALDRVKANQIADAITAAMNVAGHAQTSRDSVYEPELRQYGVVMSFDVWELD